MKSGYTYNIGDIVYIKDIDWFKKQIQNKQAFAGVIIISKSILKHCGKKATIINEFGGYKYVLDIDNRHIYAEEMFETLQEARKNKLNKINGIR